MAEARANVSGPGMPLPGRIPGRLYDSMGNDVSDIAHLMGGGVYDHRGRCVVGETSQRQAKRVACSRQAAATKREPRRKPSIGGLLVGVIRFLYRIIMAW